MSEHKVISRQDKKVDKEIHEVFDRLNTAFLSARAKYGEDSERTMAVINKAEREWVAFVKKFNKRNTGKYKLDPDYFVNHLAEMDTLEKNMAPMYKKAIESHKYDRWLNKHTFTNKWFWLWRLLEWVAGLFGKSFYKWRYEKVSS